MPDLWVNGSPRPNTKTPWNKCFRGTDQLTCRSRASLAIWQAMSLTNSDIALPYEQEKSNFSCSAKHNTSPHGAVCESARSAERFAIYFGYPIRAYKSFHFFPIRISFHSTLKSNGPGIVFTFHKKHPTVRASWIQIISPLFTRNQIDRFSISKALEGLCCRASSNSPFARTSQAPKHQLFQVLILIDRKQYM
jgi:hypothetical protein